MKLICEITGVEVEATEEAAEVLLKHGFKVPEAPKPKRTPRKKE